MKKLQIAKILKNGIKTQEEANLVWEIYQEHSNAAKNLLAIWGEWAKNASKI